MLLVSIQFVLAVGRRSETDGGLPDASHGYAGKQESSSSDLGLFSFGTLTLTIFGKTGLVGLPKLFLFAASWWKTYEQEGQRHPGRSCTTPLQVFHLILSHLLDLQLKLNLSHLLVSDSKLMLLAGILLQNLVPSCHLKLLTS